MFHSVSSGTCLAAADINSVLTTGLWIMLAAILGIGGVSVVMAVRRWSRREEASTAFTLQELREMRAQGEISEAEYATLRDALLGQAAVDSTPTDTQEVE
ncbi:MAG: SHOCT domain-containing protein [Planctomycetota bacterium]